MNTAAKVLIGGLLLGGIGAGAWVATRPPPPSPEAPAKKTTAKHHRAKKAKATSLQAGAGDDNHLTMPVPKACLSGPTEVGASDAPEMAASTGLSDTDVRAALSAFSPHLVSCFGDAPEGTALLSVTVGCDGRVSNVVADDDGGFPSTVLSCVQDRLRYAAFPAHDMPDGFTFSWPLRWSR